MRFKRCSIVPIFFTVFIDLLGLGIVVPILPAVLLDPIGGMLPLNYPYTIRMILYGTLTAAYPIAQFFGAPILGTLADTKGRKKLLLASLIGTLCGYIIFVVGIIRGNIYLLFIGRLVDGFTGGNISIAQSAIADISDEKTKARNFGLIGMAFGLGFVIGPYLGGKLSDPNILAWFDYTTPFFLSIMLTIINIILVVWSFPETLNIRHQVRISFLAGFKNIGKAFIYKELRTMFLVVFLLSIGHNFFTKFLQVFLMTKFNFTQSSIGDFYGYMGIWIAASQGILLKPLIKRYKPHSILKVSVVMAAFSILFILLPNKVIHLYMIIPFISMLQGMNQPNTSAIISDLAGEEKQGEIFGINQSMQAMAQAIPPIIAGIITSINIDLPIILSAVFIMLAWVVFVLYYPIVISRKVPA
ncbi:MAG: MFS transporter [Bacillota bacterium]|nr:MFS transporter [Bacillota bacterium]